MNIIDVKNKIDFAEKQYKKNNFDLAKEVLEQVIGSSPANARANELLAYIYFKKGMNELAHQFLASACTNDDCSAEALYYLGKSYLNRIEFSNANEFLTRSLNKNGYFFEGLHDLGIAKAQLGFKKDALDIFNKALDFNEKSSSLLFNLAKLHSQLNAFKDSLYFFNKVLTLSPNFAEAWLYKGILYSDAKEYDSALACFDKAISIIPGYHKAWLNKGITLRTLNEFDLANLSFQNALKLEPDNVKCLTEFGLLFFEVKNFLKAIEYFDLALSIDPDFIDALINKGITLNELRLFSQSKELYRKVLEIDPNSAICWSNLGMAESNCGNFSEALSCFNTAISLNPEYAEAWANKGVMFMDTKDFLSAVKCFKTAIKFDPDNPSSHHNLSHAYLNLNCFSDAWLEYEWRWKLKDMLPAKLKTNKPLWDGVKSNIKLFIWAEQGIGDQIMFSSMFNELQSSCSEIIISVDNKLLPLFRNSFPKFKFIDRNEHLDDKFYDYHIPIASIAKYLRQSPADFTKTVFPYLSCNSNFSNNPIIGIKNSGKLLCGLSWRSFNTQIGDKKSIPLPQLESVIKNDNLSFLNLQYLPESIQDVNENKLIQNHLISIDQLDLHNDIFSLANLINFCDLIITCSNSTAHLAGALNKPTLLLAPYSSGKFWYWKEHNGKSLWYPSIKLFYQAEDGSWGNAIQSVAQHINSLC